MKRKGITPRERFEVLKRDGFACIYCGARASADVALVIDHIEPHSAGGASHFDNYGTACQACNAGKAARPVLPEQPPSWGWIADALCQRLRDRMPTTYIPQVAIAIEVASLTDDGPAEGLSLEELWEVITSPRLLRLVGEIVDLNEAQAAFLDDRFSVVCWLEVASKREQIGLARWTP